MDNKQPFVGVVLMFGFAMIFGIVIGTLATITIFRYKATADTIKTKQEICPVQASQTLSLDINKEAANIKQRLIDCGYVTDCDFNETYSHKGNKPFAVLSLAYLDAIHKEVLSLKEKVNKLSASQNKYNNLESNTPNELEKK